MLTSDSVIQARASNLMSVNVFDDVRRRSIAKHPLQQQLRLMEDDEEPLWTPVHSVPSKLVGQRSLRRMTSASEHMGKYAYHSTTAAAKQSVVKYEVQELMLHAIAQTAVTTFDTSSLEILAQDGYTIDQCGQLRAKTFVYAENLRYRCSHQVSTFQTGLGCVWVRTTTMFHSSGSGKKPKQPQTIRSLVLYPTEWLRFIGIQSGIEIVTASAGRSWLYNINMTVTRAVPEDSLIFELCSTGQTRAVEALLEKGMASVVDTSPKGWKPLHVRLSMHSFRPKSLTLSSLRQLQVTYSCANC